MTSSAHMNVDPDSLPGWYHDRFGAPNAGGYEIFAQVGMDDCSVIKLGGEYLAITSDFVNASPISLELGIADARDLGRYLVNTNLSDLCGTGARPLGLMINVMWARDSSATDFGLLMDGIGEAASAANAQILGGDTKLGNKTVLNATAIGTANAESELFLKWRARPGDEIWVSGDLGSCAASTVGLADLDLPLQLRDWATAAIVAPSLPLARSRQVSALHAACSGTDLSDGLGADLTSLCSLSGVGAQIEFDLIPVADGTRYIAHKLGVLPQQFAFTVGGDLQFLISAEPTYSTRLSALGMTRIGRMTTDPDLVIRTASNDIIPLPQVGHRDAHALPFVREIYSLLSIQEQK